jgi:hypothetical protein
MPDLDQRISKKLDQDIQGNDDLKELLKGMLHQAYNDRWQMDKSWNRAFSKGILKLQINAPSLKLYKLFKSLCSISTIHASIN